MRRIHGVFNGVVLTVLFAAGGVNALTLSGYYKNFFVADHLSDAVYEEAGLSGPWVGTVSQRLRLDTFHRFNDRLAMNVSYALAARVQDPVLFGSLLFGDAPVISFANAAGYRVSDIDLFLLPREDPREEEESGINNFALFQNLDRLFVTLTFERFDLYVGRQAIAWGSARVVNPTDAIAPFLYTELDTEDRVGVDAARLRAPLGALGEFDIGYVAGEDFKFSESAFFLRGKTYAAKTDLTGLVVGFREHLMVGCDITRAIGGAGSWLEAAYVFANALGDDAADDDSGPSSQGDGAPDDYLRLSLGCDYSFPGNIYAYIEYHYNQAGTTDPNSYHEILRTPAYRDGAVFLLGRHYLAPGASFQITPLMTLLGQAIVNLTDPSALLVAVLDYSISEDIYLEFGSYLGVGDNPDRVIDPDPDTSPLSLNSEFGAYTDMPYTSFRIYF